ncbi:MAG: pseudouridine synthase [Pseudomonadota bacterium]|nr:pseudouridine synthase [Pseudomonadota bacterium]
MRLNKYLAIYGACSSRRAADELIRKGVVQVNGKQVLDLATQITVGQDEILVANVPVRTSSAPLVYWLLNKPRCLLVSHQAEEHKRTIFSLPMLRKIKFPLKYVGRLDYLSEGLLLLTNDGQLAYRLMHPSFATEKVYEILLHAKLTDEQMRAARQGNLLPDGQVRYFKISPVQRQYLGASYGHWYRVVVHEGRNNLLRRVFAALNMKVLRLLRVGFAGLQLDRELVAGSYRQLTAVEIKNLRRLTAIPKDTCNKRGK